ncbi:ZYRO0D07062p [Zygosaccharomyces rouxii]|uniref:ubiquitinyl hydrolase 1 n=1 Tax=Zygosaccharomyces rouxii (strain ATCC 2623 / CBS 732 / NBRC 1130 / NCYC 568 / NRRL Y-229) TaxID=559307 RepID=C5DVI8_ZYGRC|nr:uncharacterized protein ZYRO0D07062g [Zygosaccharomyces rouxii]KAH9200719.1 hypothetical protein LQ764DRAFT_177566 [Zygosaccharomyces rouxii]CAR27807.1 ZYRO0D07062p [Zygosaccharomyces rouxii]
MNDEITGSVGEAVDLGKTVQNLLPPIGEKIETEPEVEGGFTWHIDDWFKLTEDKYVSPRFKIGEFEWDILLFPQGNHSKSLAIYLEPHAEEKVNEETGETEYVDPDWYCCAQFTIVLSRPGDDNRLHVINSSHHRFNAIDTDWGFASFIDLNQLKYPSKSKVSGLLNQGQLNVTTFVRILKDPTGVLWHNFVNYDSKKMTGYVGFRNQGATCYLNSLLQSYFFTKYFRRLVYQIPTSQENPKDSVVLALQRAFYQLQVSQYPLDTMELTRSFGWDNVEAFTQHDVQELNRILMDRLETRMKGTTVENKLNEIFVGKMKSFIKCINVDYESARTEDFWDIQMNVKNLKGLKDSFENYIEVELMDGENQYAAQDYGLQDAKKGVVFESFPAVLHLQLKRFEYDFNYDQLVKINDRYEFPERIDLSPYMDKDVLEANPGPRWYGLHGVLVHTGDISTGHYYALIKPGLEDQWYRFDDERVWKVSKKQAFDENFGFDRLPDDKIRTMTREQYQEYFIARHTSAYMLVYIQEDKKDEILQPVTSEDVPEHVVTSVDKENRERELKEREIREAHLYTTVRVNSIGNFIHYQGFETFPNDKSSLFSPELNSENSMPINLKIPSKTYVRDLYKKIKECLNIPLDRDVRYWKMEYRRNGTIRLDEPLSKNISDQTLEKALQDESMRKIPTLNVFVEEPYLDLAFLLKLQKSGLLKIEGGSITDELIQNLRHNIETIAPANEIPKILDDVNHQLLFVKKFDPQAQSLTGVAYCAVSQLDEVSVLSKMIGEFIGTEEQIEFFEELQPGTIEPVSLKDKFYAAELCSGDILSFQVPNAPLPDIFPVYKTLEEFYQYLRHRIKLRFAKSQESTEEYVLSNDSPDNFEFWISAHATYSDVARVVSQFTKVQPEYLKIFAVYANGKFPMKSESFLGDYILKDFNCELTPSFEYEVLSMPLKELEQLKSMKFYWLKDSYIHYQSYEFKVTNNCTVGEFLDKIQAKIGFSDEDKGNILLWTNYNFHFNGVLSANSTLKSIGKSVFLFGRILPEELALVKQLDGMSEGDDDEEEEDISMGDEEDLVMSARNGNPKIEGRLVMVVQYFKDPENRHGISFLFNLIPGETFLKTRARLHDKFGLGQKEFSKIKLRIWYTTPNGHSFRSLQDYTDEELDKLILYNIMSNLDCIYMDHPDRLRTQSSHDRPMFIKN